MLVSEKYYNAKYEIRGINYIKKKNSKYNIIYINLR